MKSKKTMCYVVGSRGFIGEALMRYQSLRDCYDLRGVEVDDFQRCDRSGGDLNPFSVNSVVILSFAAVHNRVNGIITTSDAVYDDQLTMYSKYLRWCVEAKVKRLVLVSSTAIYGVFTASGVQIGPYARHRLKIERMLTASGLDYTIVRPSCVLSANRESSYRRLRNGVGYVLRHASASTMLDTGFLRCFSLLSDVTSAIFTAVRDLRGTIRDVATIGPCNIEYVLSQHYKVNVNWYGHREFDRYSFSCPPCYYLHVLQAKKASGVSAIWDRAAQINSDLSARVRSLDNDKTGYGLFVDV